MATASALGADLDEILRVVEIHDGSAFSIDGKRCEVGKTARPPETARGVSGSASALAEALAVELYERLFTRQNDLGDSPPDREARRRHVQRLSVANAGRGTWEPGWRFVGRGPGKTLEVERRSVVFRAAAAEVRVNGRSPSAGAGCRVRLPGELHAGSPGYYVALGEADESPAEERPYVVRLYWSLTPDSAPAWVGGLTRRLNQAGVPFRLKALRDPRHYHRVDAGVVYLEPRHYPAARGLLREVYGEVGDSLRSDTPLLVAHLAPGVGVAEGPADGSSYGRHRCDLIAGALAESWAAGRRSRPQQAAAAADAFRLAGLDPAHPHLAPGSRSSYRPLALSTRPAGPARSRRDRDVPFAEAACRIGDTLCSDAVWHDGRCSWMGHPYDELQAQRPRVRPAVAALGAELYDGTSGVALFLARLHATTGEVTQRRTAVGALRQALWLAAENASGAPPLGFHAGGLGVAWAAIEAGGLTGAAEIGDRGEEMLAALLAIRDGRRFLDVIRGDAGAVLALLDLHLATNRGELLDRARSLGEAILRAGRADAGIWRWPNGRSSGIAVEDPPLTGLSHGAAGIGLALFELWAACGERPFLDAARGAFAYEDSLFDRSRANWPDLRGSIARRRDGDRSPAYATAWCHGAPGIALARLRAMALDSQRADHYEMQARSGLTTTLRALAERPASADTDTSLCHGLCGLVEVALTAGRILGEPEPQRSARDAMRVLLRRHRGRRWPSGAPSRGPNPSLMLGQAGVGHTLLRLDEVARPASVLLPGADRRAKGPKTERSLT